MKLLGELLKLVGDIAYAINDRGPTRPPRFDALDAIVDFCYRNAKRLGARLSWPT